MSDNYWVTDDKVKRKGQEILDILYSGSAVSNSEIITYIYEVNLAIDDQSTMVSDLINALSAVTKKARQYRRTILSLEEKLEEKQND